MKKVSIIGAGLGGLSAAIHLASRGFDVSVFEKNDAVGGKAGEFVQDGFRFDTGPSLLTMPFVFDDLFAAAGKRIRDYLTLERVNPICRYFFADGTVFDASSEESQMLQGISRLSPADVEGYRRFTRYSKTIYDLTSDIFIFRSFSDFSSLLTWKSLRTLLQIWKIDPFRTVHRAVSTYFKDPRLVQVFDRYATYNGSNPYQAPATLNIIPHVEYCIGGYYSRGGIYRINASLQAVAEVVGVKFFLNTPVKRILVSGGRTSGVELECGDVVSSDAVISNADAVYTLSALVDDRRWARQLSDVEPSSSGLVLLWGVKAQHPQLAHHNIFFSSNYGKEFDELFVRRIPPSDPTVYVSVTSKTDPDHAPPGCENWFVLVNMPYLNGAENGVDEQAVRGRVLEKLREVGIDVEGKILFEHVIAPRDFQRRFNAHRGSIYGISSNDRRAAFLRPQNRVRNVKGLYLCGGAAHPGGGMPLVIISGKLAAELCARDLA